jgi:Flp pilus assembly protein TadG
MKIVKRSNKKGQAMVEMAFVIFILVILVFAITEFGRAMYTKNTLTNAARAGARAAVVTVATAYPSLSETTLNCPETNAVYDAVCRAISGGGITSPKVTIYLTDSSGGSQSSPVAGYTVKVSVKKDFQSVVPNLFGPNGWIKSFPSTLEGIASMRQEQ